MSTFTVRFEGLIVHVGADSDVQGFQKKHAGVVYDPNHHAHVLIDGAHLDPPGDDIHYALRFGDRIAFEGLTPGQATTTQDFRDRVPSLKRILKNGDLDPNVKQGLHPHVGIVAFVRYSDGTLSAPKSFDHPLEWKLNDGSFVHKQCVAEYVLFESTPTGSTVTLKISNGIGQPFTVTLKADAIVQITNVSGAGHQDFQIYGTITTFSEFPKASEDSGINCATNPVFSAASLVATSAPNPECTDSNWP